MPRYQITDNQTGKKVTIEGSAPPSEMDTEQIFKDAGLRNESQKPDNKQEDGISSMLRTMGLGSVPDVGKSVVGTGMAATGGIGYGLGKIFGNEDLKKGSQKIYNKGYDLASEGEKRFGFTPPDENKKDQFDPMQYAKQTSKDAAGLSTWFAGGGGTIPQMMLRGGVRGGLNEFSQDDTDVKKIAAKAAFGAILEPFLTISGRQIKKGGGKLLDVIKYPTKNKAGKAIQKAVETGDDIDWGDIAQEIQDKVQGKYADPKYMKAATKLTLSKAPMLGGRPESGKTLKNIGEVLSSDDLLQWRQQLGNELPSNSWSPFAPKLTIDDQVKKVARDVISSRLKQLAPNIKTPDEMYAFYSKIHGDVPTWAKRILIGTLMIKVFGKQIGNLLKSAL